MKRNARNNLFFTAEAQSLSNVFVDDAVTDISSYILAVAVSIKATRG
jgi:hypothetical protein